MVTGMLERAGAEASRPDDLEPEFGLTEAGYRLSPTQAQAILDLRLHRLTGLEQDKILSEFQQLHERIAEMLEILRSSTRLIDVISEELLEIRERDGDPRRSEVIEETLDLTLEDLITPEDVVVTLSHDGYAKAQSLDVYQAQRRGGKGKSATAMKEEDFIDKLFIANTHDTLLCFSKIGRASCRETVQMEGLWEATMSRLGGALSRQP